MINPIDFITALRESDEYIKHIYTQGSCYRFHLLLKKLYPSAKPYISAKKDHVISLIDGVFYDINGKKAFSEGDFIPIKKSDLKIVEKWSFAQHMLLRITYCPACDEDISDDMIEEAAVRGKRGWHDVVEDVQRENQLKLL